MQFFFCFVLSLLVETLKYIINKIHFNWTIITVLYYNCDLYRPIISGPGRFGFSRSEIKAEQDLKFLKSDPGVRTE